MKTLDCSDSLGALISICPAPASAEDHQAAVGRRQVYGMEGMEIDEDDSGGGCVWGEKKRRLSVEQVKALEKSFEVENKLEPDRKVKLAQDLGLQPRQVAVWFQNRRARWKTKQLERDYGLLKANYDALQHKYESLHHDNRSLLKQIKELKTKLKMDIEEDCYDDNNDTSVKEEESTFVSDFNMKTNGLSTAAASPLVNSPLAGTDTPLDLNFEGVHCSVPPVPAVFTDVKDGSSDSDSSAILNEAGDGAAAATSMLFNGHHQFMAAAPSMIKFNCGGGGGGGSNSMNFMSFTSESTEEKEEATAGVAAQKGYQPQFVKVEEYNFFSGEEACNLFSDEQAPTLHWYCPTDQWN